MTSNDKLCCIVLPRLGFGFACREFQCCLCPVFFCNPVEPCVLSSDLLSLAPRFRCEVVLSCSERPCLLFELPSFQCYINRSSLLVAKVFPTHLPYSMAQFTSVHVDRYISRNLNFDI